MSNIISIVVQSSGLAFILICALRLLGSRRLSQRCGASRYRSCIILIFLTACYHSTTFTPHFPRGAWQASFALCECGCWNQRHGFGLKDHYDSAETQMSHDSLMTGDRITPLHCEAAVTVDYFPFTGQVTTSCWGCWFSVVPW